MNMAKTAVSHSGSEESWILFSHVIRSSAEEVIGTAKRVRKPWLSTDTIAVLEEKAKAKIQNNTMKLKLPSCQFP